MSDRSPAVPTNDIPRPKSTSARALRTLDPASPAGLSPGQRLQGIAAILASGVLRLRERRRMARTSYPGQCADCPPNRLEDSGKTSPDGQCG